MRHRSRRNLNYDPYSVLGGVGDRPGVLFVLPGWEPPCIELPGAVDKVQRTSLLASSWRPQNG